jgi:hypothetical protein
VVLAGGFFASGQMLAVKLVSEMRTASMIPVKIVTAILGILFNFCGAYLAGLNGIVAAGVSFSVIYLLWMFLMSFRLNSAQKEHFIHS